MEDRTERRASRLEMVRVAGTLRVMARKYWTELPNWAKGRGMTGEWGERKDHTVTHNVLDKDLNGLFGTG